MNTIIIAGISLAVVGILVVIWGVMVQPVNLMSPGFMSYVTSGLVLLATGLCMLSNLPSILHLAGIWLATATLIFYIYSLDAQTMSKVIGFVPVIALATWLSFKFWK